MEEREPRDGERVEIQFHPATARGRVRLFSMSPRTFRAALAAFVLGGVAVAVGLAMAPQVLADHFSSRTYRDRVARRAQQGERLIALVGRLETVAGRGDAMLRQVRKIGLIYGLEAPPAAPPPPVAVHVRSIYGAAIARAEELAGHADRQFRVLDSLLAAASAYEAGHRGEVATTPARCPLRGHDYVETSGYGSRRSAYTHEIEFHPGLDLAAPLGTPILAAANGVVALAGAVPNRPGSAWWRYGNLVALRHGDRYVTLYGHCDELRVRVGQRVAAGEVIATVGRSGWATSNHLHYEVRRRSPERGLEPLDPRLFILDASWADEERLLAEGGRPPAPGSFEPLPSRLAF